MNIFDPDRNSYFLTFRAHRLLFRVTVLIREVASFRTADIFIRNAAVFRMKMTGVQKLATSQLMAFIPLYNLILQDILLHITRIIYKVNGIQ